MSTPIIIIPARLTATRLPGKPLADIGGEPMILHVWRRACAARLGPVLVAADSLDIASVIERAGGEALLTEPGHVSGSDRIYEALQRFDPGGRFDPIINLQGDVPTIDPGDLAAVLAPLDELAADIATLAAPMASEKELHDPNVVKVGGQSLPSGHIRALFFGREPTRDHGALYHHVGIYAYRRAALERFIALPPSARERQERLEQLRALDHDMRIDAALVAKPAFGVDTPADLERARMLLRRQ